MEEIILLLSKIEYDEYLINKYKKLLDTAYKNPNLILLWLCIKHKLFGYVDNTIYPGILGVFTKTTKNLNDIFYLAKKYCAPKWLFNIFEGIDIETYIDNNLYGEKYNRIVFKFNKFIFMLYYKTTNKNTSLYEKPHYCLKTKVIKNNHLGNY